MTLCADAANLRTLAKVEIQNVLHVNRIKYIRQIQICSQVDRIDDMALVTQFQVWVTRTKWIYVEQHIERNCEQFSLWIGKKSAFDFFFNFRPRTHPCHRIRTSFTGTLKRFLIYTNKKSIHSCVLRHTHKHIQCTQRKIHKQIWRRRIIKFHGLEN